MHYVMHCVYNAENNVMLSGQVCLSRSSVKFIVVYVCMNICATQVSISKLICI